MGCQCSKDSKDTTVPPMQSGQTSNDSPKNVAELLESPAQVTQDPKPSQQAMAVVSDDTSKAPVVVEIAPNGGSDLASGQQQSADSNQQKPPAPPRGKSATAMWEDAMEEPQAANESYEAYHSADSEEQKNSQAANKQTANPKKSNNRPRKKKGGRN
jgi:hypothetical protein